MGVLRKEERSIAQLDFPALKMNGSCSLCPDVFLFCSFSAGAIIAVVECN